MEHQKEKGYSMGCVCMNNLSAMLWLVFIVYGSYGACCSYDALLYFPAGCSWLVRASAISSVQGRMKCRVLCGFVIQLYICNT
jgi:hypothetical protein